MYLSCDSLVFSILAVLCSWKMCYYLFHIKKLTAVGRCIISNSITSINWSFVSSAHWWLQTKSELRLDLWLKRNNWFPRSEVKAWGKEPLCPAEHLLQTQVRIPELQLSLCLQQSAVTGKLKWWNERREEMDPLVFFLEGERLFSTSFSWPPVSSWLDAQPPLGGIPLCKPDDTIKRGEKKEGQMEGMGGGTTVGVVCYQSVTSLRRPEAPSSANLDIFTEAAGCKPPFSSSVYSLMQELSDGHSLITTLSLRPRETCSFMQRSTKIHTAAKHAASFFTAGNETSGGKFWCLCCCWGAEPRDLLSQQNGLHPVLALRFLPGFVSVRLGFWGSEGRGCAWSSEDLVSQCVALPSGTAGRWSRLWLSDGLGVWLEPENRANSSYFVFTHLILWKTTKQLTREHKIPNAPKMKVILFQRVNVGI